MDDATRGRIAAVLETGPARRALAHRDIAAVYRLLTAAGVAQATIAEAVGQSQSEVSEIIQGRRVQSYDVLARVADGLGVPRGRLGLAFTEPVGSNPGEEVSEDVKRRQFLAAASMALFGRPVLGELLELPTRPDTPTPLPSRLGTADVDAIRALAAQFQAVSRAHGGYADGLSPVASRAERLLSVPAAEPVKRDLASALAELHTVAGWAGFDAHLDDVARWHFGRAMDLAAQGRDHFGVSKALYLSGVATAERGHHDDGLKLLQLGQIRLGNTEADHSRAPELAAWMNADAAVVFAQVERPDHARSALAAAQDTWSAPNADDQADMDWVTALAEARLGHLDQAEQLVSSSVRLWEGTDDRRQATLGRITLAQLHLRAGERDALPMADQVIRDVAELRSQRARDRLLPLTAALDARRDGRELAGMARRVAASSV